MLSRAYDMKHKISLGFSRHSVRLYEQMGLRCSDRRTIRGRDLLLPATLDCQPEQPLTAVKSESANRFLRPGLKRQQPVGSKDLCYKRQQKDMSLSATE